MPQPDRRIRIGTSGWHYDHWHGPFYPEDLPSRRRLDHYVRHFDTAEINNSFYSLPTAKTLKDWAGRIPEHFQFAAKASRYITHRKKLKDPAEPLERFYGRMEALGGSLGPVLFQLPPNWSVDGARLERFLDALPGSRRAVFEFRDPSWFEQGVYDLLAEHNAAFCIYDMEGELSPVEVTADFVYVRLHGPAEQAYQGSYSPQVLGGWSQRLRSWAAEGRDVYLFFDNDQAGHAPKNALRLREMVEETN